MRWIAILVLAVLLGASSGCTLAEMVYASGGSRHYSAGDDYDSRRLHFEGEMRRWERAEYGR